jgi:hypothetical protein
MFRTYGNEQLVPVQATHCHHRSELIARIRQCLGQLRRQRLASLCEVHAVLARQPTHLVDDRCALCNESLANVTEQS